jgi:hypothetical protein
VAQLVLTAPPKPASQANHPASQGSIDYGVLLYIAGGAMVGAVFLVAAGVWLWLRSQGPAAGEKDRTA